MFNFEYATHNTSVCGYKRHKATHTYQDNAISFTWQTADKIYTGYAFCHPEDNFNDITGCNIAVARMESKILRQARTELKAMLEGINSLYYAVNMSKRIAANPEDAHAFAIVKGERIRLTEQIKMLTEEIENIERYVRQICASIEVYKDIQKSLREKNQNLAEAE